ncbi:MAG: apolipoprotein N-acyltransferase [Synechococcales bacterium]|nr:apolipoprotein N-acyltransferase [Synechococcales bacterium]
MTLVQFAGGSIRLLKSLLKRLQSEVRRNRFPTLPKGLELNGLEVEGLRASAIALLSGLVMAMAPAPLNFWIMAWVGLAPLWGLVAQGAGGDSGRSPQASTSFNRAIWLWSLTYHGISLAWITGLHPLTWLGMPWLGSVAAVTVIWLFITLWGVGTVFCWGWGLRWMTQWGCKGWQRVLLGTALWCLTETVRAYTPLDWTSIAYTQSPGNLAILHLGQLSGNMTITAAIVAVNGCWAEAYLAYQDHLTCRNSRSHPDVTRGTIWNWLQIAIALLIGSHLIGLWLWLQPLSLSTAATARPTAAPSQDLPSRNAALTIGIIQGNIPTRIKLSDVGIRQAWQIYSNAYRRLAILGADLVLTPEAALPIQWQEQSLLTAMNPIAQAVRSQQVPLVLGTFGQRWLGQPGNQLQTARMTQSLLLLDEQAQVTRQYDKVKVVPLGESLPFEDILGKWIGRLSPLKNYLTAGAEDQRFVTPFGSAAVGICYESAFPELFRHQVAAGAEWMITASNLDPYSTVLMAQQEAHDLMRAVESDRWMVRATNTGYSGVIDPHGRVIWRSPAHQFVMYQAQIQRRQTQTLYVRWGNFLTPVLVLISTGILLGKIVKKQ